MNRTELPYKLKIASPCPARWEDMGGDERVRYCNHCRKNVYNLSAMITGEAATLIKEKGDNLCARMYQRQDGTLLTADCPVGVARYWSRLKALVAGGVAAIALASASAFAMTGRESDTNGGNRISIAARNATDKVKNWLGIKPPPHALMGMVCVPISPPPTNEIRGRVCIVPPTPAQPVITPTGAK